MIESLESLQLELGVESLLLMVLMPLVHAMQMDDTYQHSSIQLFIMGLKPQVGITGNGIQGIDSKTAQVENIQDKDKIEEGCSEVQDVADFTCEKVREDSEPTGGVQDEKLSEWEARRYGSIAARLLQDVKIT